MVRQFQLSHLTVTDTFRASIKNILTILTILTIGVVRWSGLGDHPLHQTAMRLAACDESVTIHGAPAVGAEP